MKRIAIVGPGGAGKSTLARRLGAKLGLPVVYLDVLFWQPGWVEPPRERWAALQRALVGGERWILDGNYGATLDIRLQAADTVIFLDLPPAVCIWRALKRRILYAGRPRPDRAPGCPESIDWEFVRWIWTYRRRRRPQMLARLAALGPAQRVIVLRSQREVERWLRGAHAPRQRKKPAEAG